MKNKYQPDDFDNNGQLRASKSIWCAILLQSHSWLFLSLDIMTSGMCGRMLRALYPKDELLIAGLITGVVPFIFIFVYPLRGRIRRMMIAVYFMLLSVCVITFVYAAWQYRFSADTDTGDLWSSVLMVNLAVSIILWPDRRNRDVFLKRQT